MEPDLQNANSNAASKFPPTDRRTFRMGEGVISCSWEEFRAKILQTNSFGPTVNVWRGSGPAIWPTLAPPKATFGDLPVLDGASTVEQCLEDGKTEGFIALHGDKVIYERYFNGNGPETRQVAFSVSKGLVAVVVAALVEEGKFTYDARVTELLPELQGTAWDGVTVCDALCQATGIQFAMDASPGKELRTYVQAFHWEAVPAGEPTPLIRDLLVKLHSRGDVKPGELMDYNEANPVLLAWACERVTGLYWADLVSKYIWSRTGAERDAFYSCDDAGMAAVSMTLCCTLRDLALLGRAILKSDRGELPEESRVVPNGFIDRVRAESDARLAAFHAEGSENTQLLKMCVLLGFGDEFAGYAHYTGRTKFGSADALLFTGAFGQYLLMVPELKLVVARFGSSNTVPYAEDNKKVDAVIRLVLQHVQDSA